MEKLAIRASIGALGGLSLALMRRKLFQEKPIGIPPNHWYENVDYGLFSIATIYPPKEGKPYTFFSFRALHVYHFP